MIRVRMICLLSLLCCLMTSATVAQPPGTNYDESKVPEYQLPDPLVTAAGETVTDAATWANERRGEILELFRREVYGRCPDPPSKITYTVSDVDPQALDGQAVRKQVSVALTPEADGPRMHLLIYLPQNVTRPTPTFLGLNFYGNHSIHPDPGITLSTAWMRDNAKYAVVDHRATEASRGMGASRWAVDMILQRGYAVATIYYGDIDPDFDDGFENGVHPWFYAPGQTQPKADEWGSISAWAWGLSRALDYFETDADIDAKRVAVMGHSRLGKTALWAGARDPRFAIVISNNSGCGGAALSRRAYGETVRRINTSFPHWFCDNFQQYNGRESALPVDQHMLVALIAPRPVYIASAQEDRWADPRGEFLSALHAGPVYELLGRSPLGVDEMPAVNKPVMNTVAYHIREGKHDVTDFDWRCYLAFADLHFGR